MAHYLGRLKNLHSTTFKVLGMVELMFAFLLVLISVIALIEDEPVEPFILPVIPLVVLGLIQYFLFKESRNFRNVNGLMLVGLAWALIFIIGTFPYLLSGISPLDSMFESVSGFTTTGATVIRDIESMPISLQVWRSLTAWIGGLVVILIFMYLLPMFGMGRSFFRNELEGSGSSDYSVRINKAAKSFVSVYAILTAINMILLILCNMGFYEALCLGLNTISTGGLIGRNDSLMGYSVYVQVITLVFMFMGGVNFYLHYRALYLRNKAVYRSNSEFRSLSLWFALISISIFAMMLLNMDNRAGMSFEDYVLLFKDVLFTTVSLGTSSGFAVVDYVTFPSQCVILLMVVAFIGASAGSTSGGVKFGRLWIIFAFVKNAMSKTLYPNAVTTVKVDGKPIDDNALLSALSIFIMYFITLIVGSIIIMILGHDLVDALGLSISAVSNLGLGFGNYGPSGTMADLGPMVKIVMMALMWIGRLEIMLALVFITPEFWREVWSNYRSTFRGIRRGR